MKAKIRIGLGVALGILVVGQFIRPERENPTGDPELSIRSEESLPPEILAMLERSCFDCHSNETRWPWYSAITPMNLLVAHDVREARKRLNFSEWKKHTPLKRQGLLQMIDDQVSLGEMPLPQYLALHPQARLSESDIAAFSEWALNEQERLSSLAEDGRRDRPR